MWPRAGSKCLRACTAQSKSTYTAQSECASNDAMANVGEAVEMEPNDTLRPGASGAESLLTVRSTRLRAAARRIAPARRGCIHPHRCACISIIAWNAETSACRLVRRWASSPGVCALRLRCARSAAVLVARSLHWRRADLCAGRALPATLVRCKQATWTHATRTLTRRGREGG